MNVIRPTVLLAVLAGLLVPVLPVGAAAAPAANARPQTIPALQEWTGGTGTFSLGSRIVRSTAHAADLATTSQVFADDLLALTGRTVAQALGTPADLQPGDVFVALGSTDSRLGPEGYALEITDRIRITARTDAGAFYGTRTVLQLLKQNPAVPQGAARDWALKPERGLMVDNGRKYFTPDWLHKHVKELAYLKLNTLHLHLSDNQGFRIESTTHPEVVSAAHLTKQQVRDVIALAARYHVTVVPEIDMPGHMAAILDKHRGLQLLRQPTDPHPVPGAPNYGFIDVSKDAAYTLMRDLLQEYLPLFPGPYWHIGADEYVGNYNDYPQLLSYARARYGANANAKDSYLGLINWANGIVRAAGKTTRAWNDGIGGGSAVTVDPNIVIEFWWNNGLPAQQHVANGHQISNQSWDPTYYVLGNGQVVRPNVTWGYETWHPDLYQGNQTVAGSSRGSNLHIWSDVPDTETEDQVSAGIREPLRMLAQQLWGSPKLAASWTGYQAVIAAVGRNPAWSTPLPGNLAAGRPVTASSTETASFPASFAVDSDSGTRWSSGYTNGEWIQVDLGATRTVNRVRLSWEPSFGRGYQIQTSSDGATWRTIYATSTGDGGVDDLTGLIGSGRYVRMQGTARATQWGFSLWEFEVYGGTNLATGRTATASSVEPTTSHAANFATDGDFTTRWSSGYEQTEWIQVDLGSTFTVDRVRLAWEPAHGRGYQIQTSADAVTWRTIYATTTGDGGIDDLTGLVGSGRYVRMQGTLRATQFGYSLWEFEVYGGTNLALDRPATASSVEPTTAHTANLATDGNGGTRWSSGYEQTEWIQVDLGSTRTVDRVRLAWEPAHGRGYQIQTSPDGATWRTIFATTTGDGGIDDLTGLVGSGRYVRMQGTARATQWGYSLWEFEVYGGTNLAQARPTTASSVEPTTSHTANLATDGDGGTRWSSGYEQTEWIQVDLGQVRPVNRVRLAWEPAHGRGYQIQTSPDGATWRTIYATSTGDGGIDDLTGLVGSGRYVRMQGTLRATQFGYSLWEFEVYGSTNLAHDRPTTASSVEPTTWHTPNRATDGDFTTRWSSGYEQTEWIQVDLGSTRTVDRVRLSWEPSFGRGYQIQTSADAVTWRTIYATTTGDGGIDDLTGLAGSGRYVRMQGTARATQWGYSLWEFEVFG